MYHIKLTNGKEFKGDDKSSIFHSAQKAGIILEHSCLSARCKSCKVKVLDGNTVNVNDEYVLSSHEKKNGVVLSCNSIPESDLTIEVEDLGNIDIPKSRTLASKIDSIEFLNESVVKIILRLPPKSFFRFISGQYVNLIKGNIKRSYSIANSFIEDGKLEFLIKNYQDGIMSNYWFNEAEVNDLIRLEGPLGTFFMRNSHKKHIVLLATGTGIAPAKSIIEEIVKDKESLKDKKISIIWGGRKSSDIFWTPSFINENIQFIPVLSRHEDGWEGERGYVQDILIKRIGIPLSDSQVYACGSNAMIEDAKVKLINNGLPENQFFSDAFVSSN